jgi:hypothetical protein
MRQRIAFPFYGIAAIVQLLPEQFYYDVGIHWIQAEQ